MCAKKIDPMDAVLANIDKILGNKTSKPILSRFGNLNKDKVPVISFGIPAVDAASYGGGVPRGKMVEIFGPESSGKSLLTLFLIASAQKQGLECALIDVEQSFDPEWATRHGVNVNNLVYSNDFNSGEHALEVAYQLCSSGAFGVVVIDSTAALLPQSELEGSLEDNARMGEQARLLSRGCRKIVDACGKGNTTCVFINQVRDKIGVIYGSPETTPGGKALKFYSHMRIRVAKSSQIKVKEGGQDVVVGQISSVTFIKNKTARPFGKCEIKIVFDTNALNPVVMLCNTLKDAKMVKTYKGLFKIAKDVLSDDAIETGASNMNELANYLIENNYVIPLVDKIIENKDDLGTDFVIYEAIIEMKTDPSKIVPVDSLNVGIEAKKMVDASSAEISTEDKDDGKETDLE